MSHALCLATAGDYVDDPMVAREIFMRNEADQLMLEYPYLRQYDIEDIVETLFGWRYRGNADAFLRWGWQELETCRQEAEWSCWHDTDTAYEGYLEDDDFGPDEKCWDMEIGFGEIETDCEIMGSHNFSGWVTEDFIVNMTDAEFDAWLKNELEEFW